MRNPPDVCQAKWNPAKVWNELNPLQHTQPLLDIDLPDAVGHAAFRAVEMICVKWREETVVGWFAFVEAAVIDTVEGFDLTVEGEENIHLAVLAVVCPLVGVSAVTTLVHRGATGATQIISIALWAFFVCASYPWCVRFTAVLASVHLTKLLRKLRSALH